MSRPLIIRPEAEADVQTTREALEEVQAGPGGVSSAGSARCWSALSRCPSCTELSGRMSERHA